MSVETKTVCVLRGCGRPLTQTQIRAYNGQRGKNQAGPFCSPECYHDHRKRAKEREIRGDGWLEYDSSEGRWVRRR